MQNGPTSSKCLFTDDELSADTNVEHAPPRALGGRFASPRVTSSAFNNAAGATIDAAMVEVWRPLVTLLAPAMPVDARPTSGFEVTIPGDPFRYELAPGGGVQVVGTHVLERDAPRVPGQKGRPNKIVSADPERLRKVAEHSGLGSEPVLHPVDAPNDLLNARGAAFGPHYEAAVLKAALVAFDVAHGSSPDSWVRSRHTAAGRVWVRDMVLKPTVPSAAYLDIGWGTDPCLVPPLRKAAGRLPDHQLLDHVFVACGDSARRVLDVSCLIFGHEAVSFRLTRDFRGTSFCEVLGCSPLRGRPPSGLVNSPYEFILPARPGIQSIVRRGHHPREDLQAAWLDLRSDALAHAKVLGELARPIEEAAASLFLWTYREWLRDRPLSTARAAVVERMVAEYSRRPDVDMRSLAEDMLGPPEGCPLSGLPVHLPTPVPAGTRQEWATVAAPHCQAILRRAYERFGPPPAVANMRTSVELRDDIPGR